MSINLKQFESSVDLADLLALEKQISAELPASFKDFFLKQNGGIPDKDWWGGDSENEPVRVKKFKSVSKSGADDSSDTKYIGGCYAAMVDRKVIPTTLLPFAIDDGGNFFCLNMVDGNIFYYTNDSYDPDLSFIENQLNAQNWLAKNFDIFISELKDESDVDI